MKWCQLTVSYIRSGRPTTRTWTECSYWNARLPSHQQSRAKLLFQRGCHVWCIHEMMWSDKLARVYPSSTGGDFPPASQQTALICWAQNNPVDESCCALIHCICLRHFCSHCHFGRENASNSGWSPVWMERSWAGKGEKGEQSKF